MDQTSAIEAPATTLANGGMRLKAFLDGLPVEANWIAGHHIVWQTGQQNGPDGEGVEDHTHCSAFVAAVALYLDIYVLRPPQHPQELLASAQVAWLAGTATFPGPTAQHVGWRDLGKSGDAGALSIAVAAANAGQLVIAGYQEFPKTDPVTRKRTEKSGHIVVVRPQSGPIPESTGPLVISAGERNWQSIHMREPFSGHPGAWPDNIRLFALSTDLEPDVTVPVPV